ncbi:MAG: tetratricopeptide repeat protein [Candidatus Poribacteria bacterium]|nr:tetratricopeptide repeat protein [Candidatus Poribacteria bacterium]
MTRFTPSFALRIDQNYLFIIILVLFVVPHIGCIGGVDIVPLSAKIQNADNAFEEAEAISTRSDDPEEKQEAQARQQKAYDRAMSLYLEVIAKDAKAKYAQRAHYQIARIYKKHYEWDKANEHYQAIVELDPTGYYASEAKSGIASIRKNRQLIKDELANYQNYKAIYDTEPTDETYAIAANSLYKVAQAYEALENFPEAIATFERLVEEFPNHDKAVQSQYQVGNIYFYKLYDYTNSGGWGAFVAVAEKFPDTYEAGQVKNELNKTKDLLTEIKQYQDEIQRNKRKTAVEYEKLGRYVLPSEKWLMGKTDLVVQSYQQIANNWEKLRNYPNAIETYKVLIRDLSHKKYAVADAFYQVGSLYQQSAQYERAIQAFDDLLENAPESTWRNESVYQQAVCYRSIREFGAAYKGFKTYMSLAKGDRPYLREAEQIIRQYELDQDQDGYLFYQELENGTSDQDPNSQPGAGN